MTNIVISEEPQEGQNNYSFHWIRYFSTNYISLQNTPTRRKLLFLEIDLQSIQLKLYGIHIKEHLIIIVINIIIIIVSNSLVSVTDVLIYSGALLFLGWLQHI